MTAALQSFIDIARSLPGASTNETDEECLKQMFALTDGFLTDHAAVAQKVTQALSKVLADLKRKMRENDCSEEQVASAREAVVQHCQCHGANNHWKLTMMAVDQMMKDTFIVKEESRGHVDSLAGNSDTIGDVGWVRFVWEMWKFFFESGYAFGERNLFELYLKDKYGRDEQGFKLKWGLVQGARKILGHRFTEEHRTAMTMYPLWGDMQAFMRGWLTPAKDDDEHKANKLAQKIVVFLQQDWRHDVVLVVASLHVCGVSSFMHEVEHRDNAVAVGELWREHLAEVVKLQANDGEMLRDRLDRGELPFQDVNYTYMTAGRKYNVEHKGLFMASKQVVLDSLNRLVAGSESHTTVFTTWRYMLAFDELGCRRCGAVFLPGGEFSEENLTKHPWLKRHLSVVSCNAILVESGFGAFDRVITTTSQTMSLDAAGARSMASKNDWQGHRKDQTDDEFREKVPEMLKKGDHFRREEKERKQLANERQTDAVKVKVDNAATKRQTEKKKAEAHENTVKWRTMAEFRSATKDLSEPQKRKACHAQQKTCRALYTAWLGKGGHGHLLIQKQTDASGKKKDRLSEELARDMVQLLSMTTEAKQENMTAEEALEARAKKRKVHVPSLVRKTDSTPAELTATIANNTQLIKLHEGTRKSAKGDRTRSQNAAGHNPLLAALAEAASTVAQPALSVVVQARARASASPRLPEEPHLLAATLSAHVCACEERSQEHERRRAAVLSRHAQAADARAAARGVAARIAASTAAAVEQHASRVEQLALPRNPDKRGRGDLGSAVMAMDMNEGYEQVYVPARVAALNRARREVLVRHGKSGDYLRKFDQWVPYRLTRVMGEAACGRGVARSRRRPAALMDMDT